MTRSRRVGLITLLFLGAVVTELVDDLPRGWLTKQWGSAPLADAFVWTILTLLWLLPLLHPQVRRDVRFRPSRKTWTVLLLLPYPLVNVAIGPSLPALRHSTETGLLVGLAIYITVFLHAFWEELLFRGYALYRPALNPRFAIVVSTVVFVVLHLPAKYSPHGLVFVFFVGITFGLVRIVSGGLTWPIVFHVAINMLSKVLAPHQEMAWAVICVATAAISTLIVLWKHPMLKKEDAVTQCGSDQRQPLAAVSGSGAQS